MAGRSFNPADNGYVEVNKRIEEFKKEFPNGSLQSEIVMHEENLVVVKAYAYRTPDDERPGIGHSQMPIPGLTPYTENSEVENEETSAWGRAIAALGFEVRKAVASAEEVANKQRDAAPAGAQSDTGDSNAATIKQKARLMSQGKKLFGTEEAVREFVRKTVGVSKSADLTQEHIDTLFTRMDEIEADLSAATTAAGAVSGE